MSLDFNRKKRIIEQDPNLLRQVKLLRQALQDVSYPFDFSGNEPKEHPLWFVVNPLIEMGYLTSEFEPTELSIKLGYIKYNDGSRVYDLVVQPKLLFTQKFLSKVFPLIPNPYETA